jgi:GT2 family glycosyltransferase
VVPTLGTRPEYLLQCISSLRDIKAWICFVSPNGWLAPKEANGLDHTVIIDPGNLGAAGAINLGLRHLIQNYGCKFVSWIGDDDSIRNQGYNKALDVMRASEDAAVAVGYCDYVDQDGGFILRMQPHQMDLLLINCKGSKLPQPGSIIRSRSLERAGYLDETLLYAFDQDLFHKLARLGTIKIVREPVSTWRWHPNSLSSAGRLDALKESHKTRLRHGNAFERVLAKVYYFFVRMHMRMYPRHNPIRKKDNQSE